MKGIVYDGDSRCETCGRHICGYCQGSDPDCGLRHAPDCGEAR
jgi:hypothetical protein